MVKLGQLKNVRHESNIVEFKPWQSMHKSILYIGFAYIDQPEEKIGIATHIHPERDQWIFLFGARNFVEFDAEAEFFLDDNWHKITYPFYAYIPAGMTHEPLRITRVDKPIIFIGARVAPDSGPRYGSVKNQKTLLVWNEFILKHFLYIFLLHIQFKVEFFKDNAEKMDTVFITQADFNCIICAFFDK